MGIAQIENSVIMTLRGGGGGGGGFPGHDGNFIYITVWLSAK